MNLVIVAGTRPECIKLGPVVHELRALEIKPIIVLTGQHTQLLVGTPAETDLWGARSLGLASTGNTTRWLASAEGPLKTELGAFKSGVVVVQGDTMSAYAAARAAASLGIPVAHVEAGVRSWNDEEPWPEERFRRDITQLAAWHYAPTSTACANLVRDGVDIGRIRVTGNTVVSALARYSDARPSPPAEQPAILVTLHRRELLLHPHLLQTLQALAFAVAHADPVKFIWPLHPAMEAAVHAITWSPNITFVGPMPYGACVEGLARCLGVLTDSGGLQEEAATLGVPCVVLRNVTDRPESVQAGIAKVCSPTVDGVKKAVTTLTNGSIPRQAFPVFGDVTAAAQVAAHLATLTTE